MPFATATSSQNGRNAPSVRVAPAIPTAHIATVILRPGRACDGVHVDGQSLLAFSENVTIVTPCPCHWSVAHARLANLSDRVAIAWVASGGSRAVTLRGGDAAVMRDRVHETSTPSVTTPTIDEIPLDALALDALA